MRVKIISILMTDEGQNSNWEMRLERRINDFLESLERPEDTKLYFSSAPDPRNERLEATVLIQYVR